MTNNMFSHSLLCGIVLALILMPSCENPRRHWTVESVNGNLRIEVISDSIEVPFGLAFPSKNKMLVSNRPKGEILLVDLPSGKKMPLKGVPPSFCAGDGGALDILLHPGFKENGWLYYSHSVGDSTGSTMAIDRAKLIGDSLTAIKRIFTAQPFYKEPNHFGTRMAMHEGHLFFTMGERYYLSDSAQSLNNHLGKVLRLNEDGSIPDDNPFISNDSARPAIWSYGHRNPQGLVFNHNTQQLLVHEHGPKGGDELNSIHPGLNYGWPILSYGVNYDDSPVGDGWHFKEGMEPPLYHYTPSIAPSGMEIYSGRRNSQWEGNVFIGALAQRHLNRLVIRDNKVVLEERLLGELEKRVRVVKEGPDGYLYIGVDGGMILRIKPG